MAHPYESWYKSGFHSTLAAGEVTNGAASSWWDVHSSPGSWLESLLIPLRGAWRVRLSGAI
ncbi:hypothetical protein Celaphus_00015755 [Cervus elaphus hippelaphus]|uniref:Uncharacterized protein n=1 Tax=Cervus elaphus hippelaphus TaxID=46360 RepID=A0A212C1D8_CEREH|nr:hypothetical protein Celaphus_00015755 [Cervus elaphus hippelaphus]